MNESPSTREHKHGAAASLGFGLLVVSTGVAAGEREDRSGGLIAELLMAAGQRVVAQEIVDDEISAIAAAVTRLAARQDVDVVISTGGTGLTGRDVTVEAVRPLLKKEIPGFGVLFIQLSHAEIGPAAMLSRAVAGVLDRGVLLCALPGSPNACRLAVEKLILPEAAHIRRHTGER
jgi:molybdenum cofactor biosynthesis protein B